MDPNLFRVDWNRLFEVLATIIVLSSLLERALSLLFEQRAFVRRFRGKGVKEIIAFALALLVCWRWEFDALSMIILGERTTFLGEVITAAMVAGGSKGSIRLFHDVLGIKSRALREAETADEEVRPTAAARGGAP